MTDSDTIADHAPVWGVVAQLSAERFTGKVAVGAAPRVTLWCLDGAVYLTERDDDVALQTRLVTSGLVNPEQLAHGVMLVDDRVSLARLFQRVPDLDRNAILMSLRRTNEATLAAISDLSADPVERVAGMLHPTGVAEWGITMVTPPPPPPPALLPTAPTLPTLPQLPTLAGAPRIVETGRVEPSAALADDIASRIWRMVDANHLTLGTHSPANGAQP